jgi:hypothetical protein
MITVKIDGAAAARLAVFCKRATPGRVEPFAAGEAEAREMMRALDALRGALRDQGFDPR